MSQSLKIGLVLPAEPGYSETFIWSKVEGLLKSGNSVSLFVNRLNKNGEINNLVPVYSIPDFTIKYFLLFVLFKIIIQNPFRIIKFIYLERLSKINWAIIIKHLIINSHILSKKLDWLQFEFATMGIGRENVAQAMGSKSAVSFRGFDIGLYPHKHPECYNLLWQTIDKVHTISDDLYNNAIKLGLNPKTPFEKITPAIDVNLFTYRAKTILHNPIRILSVGRLTWKKGFEYSLKSMELLKMNGIRFEYRLVGDGEYREAIEYAIHQLKLKDEVLLLGELSHEKVKNEMEWADIYLQPSIQEGFCNAVLEAQAMGLLSIVTNADGLSENVLDGETGWVVPKRSPKAITEQLIKIINMNMSKYNKIREKTVKRVNNEFCSTNQINKWVAFYKYD